MGYFSHIPNKISVQF